MGFFSEPIHTMQGTFSDIIHASFEWTKTVLLRPFNLRKWFFLCIIAILAQEFSSFNININTPIERQRKTAIQQIKILKDIQQHKWFTPIIIALKIAVFPLMVFLLWLYSRFKFIFLSSVVKNDASIKAPFRENKKTGNSFFKWNILFLISIFGIFLLMILILIVGILILKNPSLIWKISLALLWGLLILCELIPIVILNVIVLDLILPIMFKDNIGIVNAWKVILPVMKSEKSNFTKYILIKLGLMIITAITIGLIFMAVIFSLFAQFGILGGVLYSVSFALPKVIRLGYFIFLFLLSLIIFIAIILLMGLVLLPIPVFFRTFSLKFLARVDEKYDLFRLT